MRRSQELEIRLREWAEEYPNSRYESLGYPSKSSVHTMMIYKGPAPAGLNPRGLKDKTPADEVEEAVCSLEKQRDGFRAAQVLRLEYRSGDMDVSDKLRRLKRIGIGMSRALFYDELWVARVHVAAWLRIPASVELPGAA